MDANIPPISSLLSIFDVDTVSGATNSSQVIKKAVAEALLQK
ncbi:MAG: FMN-binding protein [Firmicutes bacterium]|nr:FMN-binding protein [Bacillota bacterium]